MPDAETKAEEGGSGGPSADVEAGENPVADEGPGTPCTTGRRKGDDVAVDPRGRVVFVALLVLDFDLFEEAGHGWTASWGAAEEGLAATALELARRRMDGLWIYMTSRDKRTEWGVDGWKR